MKTRASIAAFALLGISMVAVAQVNLPDPNAPGLSINSAVRIIATNDVMVDHYIKRWLRQHYPGWSANPHEFREIGMERYAVVYITSGEQPARRVYFRVARHPSEDDDNPFPSF